MTAFLLMLKAIPIKYILILVLACGLVWYFKDAENAKRERDRVQENATSLRKADSVGYSQQILSKEELIEELNYNRQDLVKQLKSQGVKLKQIERLISVRNEYQDTIDQEYVLSELTKAIENKVPAREAFIDSTKCHIIEGYVNYDGQKITVNITNRQFSNITDIAAVAEKVGMRFWKWFRKKKVSITVIDSCGDSQTKVIEIDKK